MLQTGSNLMDAQRAFARVTRERRRAALKRGVLKRRPADRACLPVYGDGALANARPVPGGGVREIPIDAIEGTVEPGRARLFDGAFRPAGAARARWQALWLAERRGAVLPPISVVRIGDAYAVRDGHHRVSVAKARGGVAIDATVDAVWSVWA